MHDDNVRFSTSSLKFELQTIDIPVFVVLINPLLMNILPYLSAHCRCSSHPFNCQKAPPQRLQPHLSDSLPARSFSRLIMDVKMADAGPSTPGRKLPTITISRMLETTTSTRRFKVNLVISGVKNNNLAGEPVPHKSEGQRHLNLTVFGQDSNGHRITIEATDDDVVWMDHLSKRLARGRTVTFGRPSFLGCK
jgi:hypothetical protein